ncbi:tetratricopeptide repeat protein 34 [Pipistrellus kuhlii]|uniref:tetratricopeptide repeat protein 34 n=1 Tax=Pipistrellus kuhlii TaxID=59472 RepID=UPI001E271BCD|nr:tetratricopeptide repeat protein 34 [Pipistrellus kuhlii]
MAAQELVACLCREGDQHLALGEPPLATAFYLAAFSCHAPSAVRHVRAALAEARGAPVLATLEAWCRGESQIPAIHWDGMAVVSLTGTLACAFLATLCPDHPAAVLHALAGLLARGRHGEVVRRCGTLLAAHSRQGLALRLTRALARILSGAQVDAGLADYLQAFAAAADRTVAFVLTHQRPYLPVLVSALQAHLAGREQARGGGGQQEGTDTGQQEADGWRLLAALDPGGTWSDALSPDALLRGGRYEDCRAACSRALEADPAGSSSRGERLAALLVTRAAAAFFLDRGAPDLLRDLHAAFAESPAAARRQLAAVLAAADRARVLALLREAADAGLALFREAVRGRAELRRDSGRELLAPAARALRVLVRVAPPGARPALGARLAECLLLAGDAGGARALCERLLRPRPGDGAGDRGGDRWGDGAGDRAPLLALRGFCALHAGDAAGARADFQAAVAGGPPHPRGCVRALCGRGLLRVLAGSAYLGARDYVTACRLCPEEALLVAKAFVPWNLRGLLRTVLREEARGMLRRRPGPAPAAPPAPTGPTAPTAPTGARGRRSQAAETEGADEQEEPDRDAEGVYQLATLLMELDAEDEVSRLLAADALYRLGRLDDAHKALLVALSRRPQAAPVLARLALLQLRRGFCYDANQLVKKVVQSGDTACLQPTLDVFRPEDRQLLQSHCHARALALLRTQPGDAEGEARTREAVAYLSLAIFAAGGQAGESLLTRARCYALLGQRKTALFDFNAVLRAEPGHVRALCGRALLHLALGQQQEAVADVLSALRLDPSSAVAELRSLKPEAQALIAQGLSSHCRGLLSRRPGPGAPLSDSDVQGLLAAGEALVEMEAGQARGHLLLADVLVALGSYEEAGARLQDALRPSPPSEAARARLGLLSLKKGDMPAAARDLQCLAETDAGDLGFLLSLLEASERQGLAQAAAQEASALLTAGQPGQALGYCSLAVLAGGGRAGHLRLRAAALAELQECSRALADLDLVLREGAGDGGPLQAEDLCSRGRLLLSLGDEAGAAGAFAQALALAPAPAQSSLWARPGRAPAARVLLGLGQRCLEERRYEEAWAAAEGGLLLDPEHCGLRRLKARLRREAASGCRLH